MQNNPILKITILWLFIALCLNFHTQYELMGIFWGKDLKQEGANGEIPFFMHFFMILVHHIPLLMALLSMYLANKSFKWISLSYAVLFGLLNAFHVIEECGNNIGNLSQVTLLCIVLAANILLAKELNIWRKTS